VALTIVLTVRVSLLPVLSVFAVGYYLLNCFDNRIRIRPQKTPTDVPIASAISFKNEKSFHINQTVTPKATIERMMKMVPIICNTLLITSPFFSMVSCYYKIT